MQSIIIYEFPHTKKSLLNEYFEMSSCKSSQKTHYSHKFMEILYSGNIGLEVQSSNLYLNWLCNGAGFRDSLIDYNCGQNLATPVSY